ncbi:unnamed protein product, partial [Rotaria magnacalcarata]
INLTTGDIPAHMSSAKKDILVYVPDIPSDIADNDGEQMIQTRLQNTLSIKVKKVKCYSKLGVAVIQVTMEDHKTRLVSVVDSIVLDPHRIA